MKEGFLIPICTAKPAQRATMAVRSMTMICRDKGDAHHDRVLISNVSQLTSLSRSSSFSARFRFAGGPNSIDHFARSWQRAACFPEVLPRRPSFGAARPDEEWTSAWNEDLASRSSLSGRPDPDYTRPLLHGDEEQDGGDAGHSKKGFPSAAILSSSLDRSLGTSYGTISSRVSESARRNAIQFHREQVAHRNATVVPESEPLLVKQIEHDDGTRENVVVGQSTVPQTVFNSVNVLIGVGLLSLPLAMKYAGWLLGLSFLLFAAVTTAYTAKILAKCLDVDRSLVTYADVAYISFGHHARIVTSLLFCLELLGACVALVVLFADSLHALIPSLSILQWKIICGFMLMPLNFVPLRLLSVTSILGILSCTSSVSFLTLNGARAWTKSLQLSLSYSLTVWSNQTARAPFVNQPEPQCSLTTGLLFRSVLVLLCVSLPVPLSNSCALT